MSIRDDIISIPSGRLDLVPEGMEIIDKRVSTEVEFPEFKFTLRESQQRIYEAVDSSCIINAAPSWGKTFTAIAIAAKLKRKTLIVTHTLGIRDMWEKEIKKTLGITPGIIGSSKFNIEPIIVVGNIQTLVKHSAKLSKEFGTIILDECHHAPASTFTAIINQSKAQYKIGLSGTLDRKDGMHVVLPDYFTRTLFRPPRENMMLPEILRIPLHNVRFQDNSEVPWAHRVNDLLRNKDFFNIVITAVHAQNLKGHKVLIVCDRVQFLKDCQEIFEDNSVLITGEVKDPVERERLLKLVRTGKADNVFATTSIFSEGISENVLSSLILTTPINNDSLLEQLIGRIVRVVDGKLTPQVIDFIPRGATASRQANLRRGLYIKKGYSIQDMPPVENDIDKDLGNLI